MRWRIRHKLTLGLALVVGIMALLLFGTLKGLLSYRSTMKTIDNKLEELRAAQRLQEAVGDLTSSVDAEGGETDNPRELLPKIAAVRDALNGYHQKLNETVLPHREGENGYNEVGFVQLLGDRLTKLATLVQDGPTARMLPNVGSSLPQPEQRLAELVRSLDRTARNLGETIHTDLNRRIAHSKRYRTSLGLVGCTTVLGVLFTIGLAQLAYRWISHPIRDLHEQVARLAQGNFDARIEVQSGDEMQELAAAFNDMTNRLQAIYRDLARQVNERSRQLVRSERLAGVGFLAAGVAHEINNPLASIAFCSEALERRLADLLADPGDPAEAETVRNYLKLIQQEAFRCKEITQRLLEFSRVGERQRQLTDLAELLQGVIDMVLHLQSYQGKQIIFEPCERLRVEVNAPEIKSVVLNLVVNALESMDEGGVLTITLEQHDRMAELTFTDGGCGMTAEVLENIFEPFFTRSRTGRGTGLGLSISHRIVNQHGGEIEAGSPALEQGSTFTVRLPLQATVAEEPSLLAKAA